VSGDRRPDPCHDFVELSREVTHYYPVYQGEKSDGLVVYRATWEPNLTKWVEIPHMNHQELKSHHDSREKLKFLFEGLHEFKYDDFSVFYLK